MTCKICGKQLPAGSTVCKYCGARVRSGDGSRPDGHRYSKKGLARKRTINLIISVLALIVIAAVIVGIVWSAKKIAAKPAETDPGTSNTASETPENTGDTASDTQDPPVIQDEQPQPSLDDAQEQQPAEETPEETPEDTAPETPAEETPAEEPAQQPETPEAPQPATDGYTIALNRTETTASLNHYRELRYSISQELPAGVSVASTSWTSSNEAVVRAEEGRAWGVSLGEATVTVTVNLSNGHSMSADCLVHVVEKQVVTYTDYVLPESNTRVYSQSELAGLSLSELFIARNEIYARHGRQFTDKTLQDYFSGKSWYSGTIAPSDFDASVLNSCERQNVDAILAAEAARS